MATAVDILAQALRDQQNFDTTTDSKRSREDINFLEQWVSQRSSSIRTPSLLQQCPSITQQ
eukprot:8857688-Pyramimonas_sp.AAC.1